MQPVEPRQYQESRVQMADDLLKDLDKSQSPVPSHVNIQNIRPLGNAKNKFGLLEQPNYFSDSDALPNMLHRFT